MNCSIIRLTRAAAVLASLSLVGCGEMTGPDEYELASAVEAPIVNGQVAMEDPAVVALTVSGQPFCTGTLISPHVVLTAAHCVDPSFVGFPPTFVEIFFGTQVPNGTFIPVVEGSAHPSWSPNSQTGDHDVGALRMSFPSGEVPIKLGSAATDGQQVRLVGFGVTFSGGSDSGIKRQANAVVAQTSFFQFAAGISPSGTCNGDSGGPALRNDGGEEVVVGIHSLSDCQSFFVDEQVAAHTEAFILPFVGDDDFTCALDGGCATGCSEPDPDCPCAADGLCTTACDDLTTDSDCDPACAADGVCIEAGCAEPDPDCVVDQADCTANGECNPACTFDADCPCDGEDCEPITEDGGDGGEASGGDSDDDGCSVRPGTTGSTGQHIPLAAWLAAGVAVALGRRRRASRKG